MTVTQAQDELVSEIRIAATPDRVFQALTDPTDVTRWWGQKGMYRCTDFAADLRVGGHWRCAGTGRDGGPMLITGEILELDPPHVLCYSWVANWTGNAKTIVRWELTPVSNGTLVRIRHSGLAAYPAIAESYRGWPRMLGWLQALLERGETVETRVVA